MTVSTEAWHTGLHPYTLQPVYSAHSPADKLRQRMFFFWYKPEERQKIIAELRRINRPDLIDKLFGATYKQKTPTQAQNVKPSRIKNTTSLIFFLFIFNQFLS